MRRSTSADSRASKLNGLRPVNSQLSPCPIRLPSEIYAAYAFATKLKDAKRSLPKVHLIVKNRLTQYMGAASAYAAVLTAIEKDIGSLMKSNPEIFGFKKLEAGFTEIRDFQTTG